MCQGLLIVNDNFTFILFTHSLVGCSKKDNFMMAIVEVEERQSQNYIN